MASKPAPTRASTRKKPTPVPAPTTTRITRARTATTTTAIISTVAVNKPVVRKPLVNRENSAGTDTLAQPPHKLTTRKTTANQASTKDAEREPIMAYLRIRPRLGDDEAIIQPYLTPLSDTTVRMSDPNEQQNNLAGFRPSALPPSSTYTFSHVFPPDTTQSDFFAKTTLPLVRDVLQGQNGLLFTYGVTNSGKTYTVQGGSSAGSAGMLPRTLDVIFNSIEGLHGDGRFRPVRLHGVEPADPSDSKPPQVTPEPAITEVFGQNVDLSSSDTDIDSTVLKVDRNYEYTIWISYAEVYNEKVYDLLECVKDDSNHTRGVPRGTTNKSMVLTRVALPLKPSPASDNGDSSTTGKYISGLRQFRVHSASQAKALVKLGQLHRRVFGTLANSESSRSHGLVFIKVMKGHRGDRDDPMSLQISRLTLVDLAGSERTKHTHTTGDRLREAGNINKSLMVLGQCMEVMRSNQRKLAMSLAHEGSGREGRMDTKDVKKTLSVVPFRHSKLTEALMDYFVSDGRAVMIVNVNPYDTGYDENSHVMRFAALAREVYVTPAPAPVHRIKGPGKMNGTMIKELGPLTLKDPEIVPLKPYRRKVTISTGGQGSGQKPSEAILEVLEEDEPNDDQEEDDEPINPLVDALFDEVEYLRLQLFESEMRYATIEAETREEVMCEMDERMKNMEEMYSRRLMKELERNELKTDAKIDMLHKSGLFGSPVKQRQISRLSNDPSDEEEESDVEMSLVTHELRENKKLRENSGHSDSESASERSRSHSLSPLTKKGEGKSQTTLALDTSPSPVIREVRKFVPDQPLLSYNEAEITEAEVDDEESEGVSGRTGSEDDDYDDDDYRDDNGEGDSVTSSYTSANDAVTKAKDSKQRVITEEVPSQSIIEAVQSGHNRVHKLMQGLTLDGLDDSVIILPSNKSRQSDEEDANIERAIKKKKRQLGKKPIITEEEIEKTASLVEWNAAKIAGGKGIRRLTGR